MHYIGKVVDVRVAMRHKFTDEKSAPKHLTGSPRDTVCTSHEVMMQPLAKSSVNCQRGYP